VLAERGRTQGEIDREAGEWLARREMAGLTAVEAAEFEAWRAADPVHAQAFEAMSRTLADVASLQSLAEIEPLEPPRPAWRGRTAGAAFGAMAAALVGIVAIPALLDRPDVEASTLVAEIRPITLPDGTRVTLGARSEIKARFDKGERRVELTRGEAFFEIAEDATRPFVVDAGGTEIRDIGTSFDVKRAAGKVEVGVLEGIVEVRPQDLLGRQPIARLHAGQRVRAKETGLGPIVAATRVGAIESAPTAAGAWREGQLAYDDTRLADVVADLNRYYGPGVRLESGALGEVRLAASFKAHEIDKFLQELPAVAPVVIQRDADGAVTIAAVSEAASR
jgi:transmembrane sensor